MVTFPFALVTGGCFGWTSVSLFMPRLATSRALVVGLISRLLPAVVAGGATFAAVWFGSTDHSHAMASNL